MFICTISHTQFLLDDDSTELADSKTENNLKEIKEEFLELDENCEQKRETRWACLELDDFSNQSETVRKRIISFSTVKW